MGNKLYVGNLPFSATETELQDLFAQAGAVTEVHLAQDKFTGRPRGFAFITLSGDAEAADAISKFHGYQLGGRTLTVNEARPREDRPAREGGGGGYRGGGGGGERRGGGGGGGGRGGDREYRGGGGGNRY